MKSKLILTIGCMASGKSTWSLNFIDEQHRLLDNTFPPFDPHFWLYVSQDEQGKTEHLNIFNKAISKRWNIIVDRTNFTKEQRLRYVQPAKAAGYEIEYHYFHVPYAVAFDRIVKRQNHPSIKFGDKQTAYKALNLYFDKEEFENIRSECDTFIPMQERESGLKVLDLSKESEKFKRVLVTTDLHGCYFDFINALGSLKYDPQEDMLLILGDLNDRGDESHLVFDFALKTPNVYVTDSNHGHKLKLWLRGNAVHTDSIQGTIDQLTKAGMLEGEKKHELYAKMMDFPYIIKIHNNYFTHAGFNPRVHPEYTSREFCMYARYYDDKIGTFTREAAAGYWYDKPRAFPQYNLWFGHIVIEDIKKACINDGKGENGHGSIMGLDGGICFGEKIRIAVLHGENFNDATVYEGDVTVPKKPKDDEWDHMNKFETYDKLVEQGFLRKQEKGSLVLYNYTEKCTYERYWNKYTMECRGLILDRITGDTVARPLPKFFNEFELDNKTLPQAPVNEPFVAEEKLDGSLGICYLDPSDDKYKIATRGSFSSDQAIIATTMFQEAYEKVKATDGEKYNRIHATLKRYTPCFEIIYPENRFNDGARLVVDYGTDKTLVLLCAINKETGKDLSEDLLQEFGDDLGFRLRKTYHYTKEEIKELQKTWPVNFEGVVMRYSSGFRIKYKGSQYCQMQKILNSISPISIWEKMKDNLDKNGVYELGKEYKALIPEEILTEVNEIEDSLLDNAEAKEHIALACYEKALNWAKENHPDNIKKGLGIFKQTQMPVLSKYGPALFLIHNNQLDKLTEFAVKLSRPTANEL